MSTDTALAPSVLPARSWQRVICGLFGVSGISGTWHMCDDGIMRPVIHAEIQARDGSWAKAPLLVDTGADRTVFSTDILQALRLQPVGAESQIGGVGGVARAIIIATRIRLTHENNGKVMLQGDSQLTL